MQYREDKQGTKLSVLGYGCMRFPLSLGVIDTAKTRELILSAYNKGVNYFDTAYIYPGSEAATGEILKQLGIREKIYLATKLPHYSCNSAKDFNTFFNTQKERLRTNYIDYYLIHNITDFAQWERVCGLGIKEWIKAKKESGEIRNIGFSFHGEQGDFFKLLDAYDWDFVQIQYNYMNTNYQAGEAGLKRAAEKGIPVIIMEPLLGGKLANGLPKEAARLISKNTDGTPAALALRWIWSQPEVTLLLSGMNEHVQIDENVRLAEEALPGSLTETERETVERVMEIIESSKKIPCTGCNYCLPCPKKINIPACFAAYNASYAMNWKTGISQYVTSSGGMSGEAHFAGNCIKCGKCESKCPQKIEIRSGLKAVKRRFEIPGLKLGIRIAKRVSARPKKQKKGKEQTDVKE